MGFTVLCVETSFKCLLKMTQNTIENMHFGNCSRTNMKTENQIKHLVLEKYVNIVFADLFPQRKF